METIKYKTFNIAAPCYDSFQTMTHEKEVSQSLLGSWWWEDEESGKTMGGRSQRTGQKRQDSKQYR
jgi:hypothetical protein